MSDKYAPSEQVRRSHAAAGSAGSASAEFNPQTLGALTEFNTPGELLHAAEKVRDAGYTVWDCHSPFPVHGLDKAMSVRPTKLPFLVFVAGLTGASIGLLMQWWMNAVDYPFIISGKPFFSVPASIPIMFELTILFSAFGAFFGMLALNKLPRFYHPVFESESFKRATSDRFFISIEATDPKFDSQATKQFLETLGGTKVEVLESSAPCCAKPQWIRSVLIIVGSALLIPLALIARSRFNDSEITRIHPIPDMDQQPKYKAQAENEVFADKRAMRLPIKGTVARGELVVDDVFHTGRKGNEFTTTFPKEADPTAELLMRGKERYAIFCAACHGEVGEGDGPVQRRVTKLQAQGQLNGGSWTQPTNLQDEPIRNQSVGQLFHTITVGVRNMPSYAGHTSARDRWAIVAYVKALQKSQNATTVDVKPEDQQKLRIKKK